MKIFTDFISINSRLLALAVLLILYIMPIKAFSSPFSSCPSEAFLVQDTVAKIYGVELATGHYQELSNSMGTSGKLNALAFNFHDKYLYAWSYEHVAPVKQRPVRSERHRYYLNLGLVQTSRLSVIGCQYRLEKYCHRYYG